MKKGILFILIILLAGGAFHLATHDIPAPRPHVEKAISNERIFK